ncbi:MAG TPA: hypothetical protein VL463_04660 [Kofleriaceae bacterium]|jgi:hypothetical protein|nr:hypothetical protein [Kofleriaceae bacterium]
MNLRTAGGPFPSSPIWEVVVVVGVVVVVVEFVAAAGGITHAPAQKAIDKMIFFT